MKIICYEAEEDTVKVWQPPPPHMGSVSTDTRMKGVHHALQFNKGEPTPARAPLAEATQHINLAAQHQQQEVPTEAAVKPVTGTAEGGMPPAPPPLPPRVSLMPGGPQLLVCPPGYSQHGIRCSRCTRRIKQELLGAVLRTDPRHRACSAASQPCSSSAQGGAQAASAAACEGLPCGCRSRQDRAAAAGWGMSSCRDSTACMRLPALGPVIFRW